MLFNLFLFLRLLASALRGDRFLALENIILKKENEILKRKLDLKRIRLNRKDKLFFVILNILFDIRKNVSLFSPATLLAWQRVLINNFWTFFKPQTHPGRPPVPADVRNLILDMKNGNLNWGARRIRDELLKLGIDLHRKTVQNILNDFHRRGKIRRSLTWKMFLKSHAESICAMDYFTVDSVFSRRWYVFFLISHKTREIVQCAIATNPTKEFVKQQLIDFEQTVKGVVYLIHDRDPAFMCQDYLSFGIKDVAISIKAPDMNAIAERFVRSVRSEALDNFIILNEKQVSKIIKEYIEYYNTMRPHQGINAIPKGIPPDRALCSHHLKSTVYSKPVLSGLHHHYYYKESA